MFTLKAKLVAGLLLLLVITSLFGAAMYYRGNAIDAEAERDKARADLATAVAVNKHQEETIGRLRAQAEADAKITAELQQAVAKATEALATQTEELNRLRGSNVEVRQFLDTPVPPELRRLYDR